MPPRRTVRKSCWARNRTTSRPVHGDHKRLAKRLQSATLISIVNIKPIMASTVRISGTPSIQRSFDMVWTSSDRACSAWTGRRSGQLRAEPAYADSRVLQARRGVRETRRVDENRAECQRDTTVRTNSCPPDGSRSSRAGWLVPSRARHA